MTPIDGVAAECEARSSRFSCVALLWVALLLPAVTSAAEAAGDRIVRFDISRQRADKALIEFAEQADVTFIFPVEEARKVTANAVRGELTPQAAIDKLLAGTGLQPRVQADGALTVNADQSLADKGDTVKKRGLFAGLIAALTASTAVNVKADQATEAEARPTRLEEVKVTATKRVERVQDIPLSIAVISNEDIERRGLIGMEDYLRSIPGVNQIDNGSISNAVIIRGLTTSPVNENVTSGTTVGSYFDETPITGAAGPGQGGIDVRPVDIERIEVLRGPQGTAYGSASLAGTIRMIPVKPQLDGSSVKVAGFLSSTEGHGSENWMGQGIVNVPIVKDKVALRAVAYRYDESGFYRNIAGIDPATIAFAESFGLGDFVGGHVQEDVGQTLSTGGRIATLWEATDELNLSMNFLTQTIEQDGQPVAGAGRYEQTRFPIAPQGRVRGEAGEIADTEIDLMNLVLNYDVGWAELTSAVSWIDSGGVWALDLTRTFLFPSSATVPSDFQSFTGEVRLASQLQGRFQFLGGLFYENVEDGFFQTVDWPGTPATNPFGTDPMLLFDSTRKLEQLAVFGELSYDLTDKLTATVGGRYFDYEKNERSLLEGGLVGVPIGAGIPGTLESSEGDSTFKGNLSYKPTEDGLLYASWAEGFRLGRPQAGVPPAVCDTDNDGVVDDSNITIESTREVNSDYVESYEIGGKFALLNRRMTVDTAAYHISWKGLPIEFVAGSCPIGFTANLGAATSTGVEFQASLFVVEGLRLDFGAGYTKAELSEDVPTLGAEDGARLPGSPEVNANLSAQYDFEIAGHSAFIRADSFYTGEFYGNLQETPDTRAGDYVKVDARAGVTIGRLSAEIFAHNLTNEDAFTWRTPGFFDHRLRPRTVGVQFGYSFE